MKLNMFRATHRSSSGAKPALAASGFSYVEGCLGMQLVNVVKPSGPDKQPSTYEKPEAASAVLAPDDERCVARNMLSFI